MSSANSTACFLIELNEVSEWRTGHPGISSGYKSFWSKKPRILLLQSCLHLTGVTASDTWCRPWLLSGCNKLLVQAHRAPQLVSCFSLRTHHRRNHVQWEGSYLSAKTSVQKAQTLPCLRLQGYGYAILTVDHGVCLDCNAKFTSLCVSDDIGCCHRFFVFVPKIRTFGCFVFAFYCGMVWIPLKYYGAHGALWSIMER